MSYVCHHVCVKILSLALNEMTSNYKQTMVEIALKNGNSLSHILRLRVDIIHY